MCPCVCRVERGIFISSPSTWQCFLDTTSPPVSLWFLPTYSLFPLWKQSGTLLLSMWWQNSGAGPRPGVVTFSDCGYNPRGVERRGGGGDYGAPGRNPEMSGREDPEAGIEAEELLWLELLLLTTSLLISVAHTGVTLDTITITPVQSKNKPSP